MIQTNILNLETSPYIKHATIYFDDAIDSRACILYFHGGGLLFGNREDLPDKHLQTFTSAGYTIIAFDYPLAPAAKLDMILDDVCASVNDYLDHPEKYTGKLLPYFLWGRSSGAYLCLIAAASGKLKVTPAAVLSYYGYGFLCDNWYQIPSKYYLKLPAVTEGCMNAIPEEMHADGVLETHYTVYVYARQTGKWKDLIYDGRDKFFLLDYSLRTRDKFPCPLFCAHSTGDTDVPYSEFLELCNRYHAKRFIAATDTHDFDRDESSPFTERLLEATLSFLEEKLPSEIQKADSREN
jgi:alpha-beta hydrolase superfamily lysophospholipase